MPRISQRPGPKSKQHKSKSESSKNVKAFLGDGSTAEDTGAEDSFRSADLGAQTDYGLDFTTSNVDSPRRNERGSKQRESDRVSHEEPSVSTASRRTANSKQPILQSKRRRKQMNPERRDMLFWKTVGNLQKRTDNLVPKAAFGRVIREILSQVSTEATKVTYTALVAIQEASELYLTSLFQDAYCCTLHRGRVTLSVKDIELTRFLRGVSDPGNR